MKITIALLLNTGLLWLLWRWLRRVRPLPQVGRWVLPTLALKLLVTAFTLVKLTEDALYFMDWSRRMTDQLWQAPGQWLQMLPTDEFHWQGAALVFHGFSNTLFLVKLLSVLNLASLGSAGLNALYLSVFSFVGSWELVRQLRRLWPEAVPLAAVGAFLLWPTVLYWTSGLTKESLLVGSGALVLAAVLRLAYGPPAGRGWVVAGLLAAALLHFKMRYFFAVVLFGVLAGLGLIRVLQQLGLARHRLVQAALLLGLLAGGGWAAGEVSTLFRPNKFTSQLQRNYTVLLRASANRPHLHYPNLQPTTASVLQHAPLAALNTLVRPWPWEGDSVRYVAAGLENLLLLTLLGVALMAIMRGHAGRLPFAVVAALLLYCLLLAALLGLTTPNLGTLSRYRTTFLPFLLLLLLQNNYVRRWLK
ncbi:hypothetical protein [Hymenobacter psychrophilus]|uniref:Glycosyltransferase RgtA/B/C/D-like domain-containing protein n=1 Tax=Hymenobacter psychrophilus TaxID=651662 RepID=A0A1H3D4E3_9BACT|nr:hypothetical protein [Hymenobacter psychrophilus]SDX60998.1 hypothetical protein SAMN04488069_102211 [Hymenobacter psychrophilus]